MMKHLYIMTVVGGLGTALTTGMVLGHRLVIGVEDMEDDLHDQVDGVTENIQDTVVIEVDFRDHLLDQGVAEWEECQELAEWEEHLEEERQELAEWEELEEVVVAVNKLGII
jgi:hypothetical protein